MSGYHLVRAYDPIDPAHGPRFLIDRLWPRGKTKDALQLAGWVKGLSPSNELRKAVHSGAMTWPDFTTAYEAELSLQSQSEDLYLLLRAVKTGPVSLVLASRELERNHGMVLKMWLETQIK